VIRLPFPLGGRLAARWRHRASRRSLVAAGWAGLAAEPGERVLSACRDHDGGYALVATDRALYLPAQYRRAEPGGWSRLGWERVSKVAWDGEAGRFVITVLSGTVVPGPVLSGTASARIVVAARERGVMPELAAERMTHAYLGRWTVPLGDGQDILVEARRRPGTGRLLWAIVPDGCGLDFSDGDVRGRMRLGLARLAAEFGT
jgi:hypothetical protein